MNWPEAVVLCALFGFYAFVVWCGTRRPPQKMPMHGLCCRCGEPEWTVTQAPALEGEPDE